MFISPVDFGRPREFWEAPTCPVGGKRPPWQGDVIQKGLLASRPIPTELRSLGNPKPLAHTRSHAPNMGFNSIPGATSFPREARGGLALSCSSHKVAVMASRMLSRKTRLGGQLGEHLAEHLKARPDQWFPRGVGCVGLTRIAVPSDRMGWRSTNAVIRGGVEEVSCGLGDD